MGVTSRSTSEEKGRSTSASESVKGKYLDEKLRDRILAGLVGQMTEAEIRAYAENLLRPQLHAGLEEAQQNYEATKLSREQEIENLALSLRKAIEAQEGAYKKSMADIETGALARGMGRSSYTMQTMANQGKALAGSIQGLTDENQRLRAQIQKQITQAAEQNAQTQGRLNRDYAANLAAKTEELRRQQKEEYNRNYLTAVSGSIGETSREKKSEQKTGWSQTSSFK